MLACLLALLSLIVLGCVACFTAITIAIAIAMSSRRKGTFFFLTRKRGETGPNNQGEGVDLKWNGIVGFSIYMFVIVLMSVLMLVLKAVEM